MEIIIRQIKIAISLTFLFLPPLSSQGGDLLYAVSTYGTDLVLV